MENDELMRYYASSDHSILYRLCIVNDHERSSIVFENSDTTKKVNFTLDGDSVHIYNSALWVGTLDNQKRLYLTLFASETINVGKDYSYDGGETWNRNSTAQFMSSNNGFYTNASLSRLSNYIMYMINFGNYDEILESYLPYYTDGLEYIQYITEPIVPTSWNSVSSITGRGKTINLPVMSIGTSSRQSGKDTSAFDSLPLDSCNVKRLANLAVSGE